MMSMLFEGLLSKMQICAFMFLNQVRNSIISCYISFTVFVAGKMQEIYLKDFEKLFVLESLGPEDIFPNGVQDRFEVLNQRAPILGFIIEVSQEKYKLLDGLVAEELQVDFQNGFDEVCAAAAHSVDFLSPEVDDHYVRNSQCK